MKLTKEKIQTFSSKDYLKYREYIKDFYKFNKDYSDKIKAVYWDIKQRCTNSKRDNYKYYGKRGIKCLITEDQIKFLWYRDKAYFMKIPSIDRKDNNGNYTLDNCQFIEQSENTKKRFNKT